MRVPTYLSPSQLSTWEKNAEEYYLQHLAEIRSPKMPQMNYMSIGSAFDAYVKSAMHETIFGKGADPKFEFDAIFTEQVEEHNRDWALEQGKYVFDCYKILGAYDDLMELLKDCQGDPQFETRIDGLVDGVPMLGKPDLRFINKLGVHVILDWKCNGFCSKSATSPCKNFRLCRDGWTPDIAKATIGTGNPHKNYKPVVYKGIEMHSGYMEETSTDWADQVAIYSWILGEPVGVESVLFCIDQICGKPRKDNPQPLLRVANHRCRISSMYQHVLMGRIHDAWNRITSGHIFKDMTLEESKERCDILDQQAVSIHTCGDWFNSVTRSQGFK